MHERASERSPILYSCIHGNCIPKKCKRFLKSGLMMHYHEETSWLYFLYFISILGLTIGAIGIIKVSSIGLGAWG